MKVLRHLGWSWLVVLLALLAPWIAPQNPYDIGRLELMSVLVLFTPAFWRK